MKKNRPGGFPVSLEVKKMFPVWQSVKVKSDEHARNGMAGVVQATNPQKPDEVAVRFDADLVVEVVAVADLAALQ